MVVSVPLTTSRFSFTQSTWFGWLLVWLCLFALLSLLFPYFSVPAFVRGVSSVAYSFIILFVVWSMLLRQDRKAYGVVRHSIGLSSYLL